MFGIIKEILQSITRYHHDNGPVVDMNAEIDLQATFVCEGNQWNYVNCIDKIGSSKKNRTIEEIQQHHMVDQLFNSLHYVIR